MDVVSENIDIAVSSVVSVLRTVGASPCEGCSVEGAMVSTVVVSAEITFETFAAELAAKMLLTETITNVAIAANTNFFICVDVLNCDNN